jgi:hypothetical protein
MNDFDDRQFDQRIGAILSGDAPHEVAARLRGQLAEFRDRVATNAPATRTLAPTTWWGLAASAAVVVAVAAAIGLLWRPQISLGEVADAVAKQAWVHVRSVRPSGRKIENWYSLPQKIVAFRGNDTIEYHDHHRKVYDSYDEKEQVLYRLPAANEGRLNQYESAVNAITALFQLGRPVDKPLETLDFLGSDREGMKLVSQDVEKVTENGRSWLDYRLTVTHPELTGPMTLWFRVDAASKLPRLFRMEWVSKGERVSGETQFDYPESGPRDVYALGVPRAAKIVDRVPRDDVRRIVMALEAGRERMDPYRAVFVRHGARLDYAWWCDMPSVFYRQGDKLRTDEVARWEGDIVKDRPAPDADLGAWWRKRVAFFRWYPDYVMIGSTWYSSKLAKDGEAIVEVKKYEQHSSPGNRFPSDYSMRPEFACRPPMGIGAKDMEPVVDLDPKEGPEGCMLLTVRHTSDVGRIDEKGVGSVDESRYWLDPQRDYIVMRWDSLVRNAAGELELYNTTTTEEVAQSPRGVWYATRIRRTPHHTAADGQKVTGDVYHLYVDFDVKFDEGFFDPPRPGKIE